MKNFKLLVAFVLLLNSFSTSWGQNEIWYFGGWPSGGLGLDFSGGGAPAQKNDNVKGFYESVAVLSDGSGKMLFYTDGLDVYDQSHVKMPQSVLTKLSGANETGQNSGSSLNGVIIVKQPGSNNLYWILTVGETLSNGANGFRYTVVDITLAGNGTALNPYGDFVPGKINQLVDNSAPVLTEMMAAYGSPCGDTVWVVVKDRSNGNFYSYPLTSAGSFGTKVTSTSTMIAAGGVDGGRGSMDISPDGKKIGAALTVNGGAYIFDFNASTGALTNQVQVSTGGWYGCEFSPDSKIFYCSLLNGSLIHYNIATATKTTIDAGPYFFGDIERGPDDRLYIGKWAGYGSNTLGVIANPNSTTATAVGIGYNINGQTVGATTVSYGLPQPVVSNNGSGGQQADITSNSQTVCNSLSAFQLNATPVGGNWSSSPAGFVNAGGMFDPAAGSGVGPWTVKVYYGNPPCLANDSITITVNVCCPPVSTSSINDTCLGSSIDLSSHVVQGTGTWSIVSGTGGSIVGNNFTSNTAGTFTVRYTLVPDPGGSCTKYSEQTFDVFPLPVISVADHEICNGDPAWVFDAGAGFSTYSWTGPVTGSSRTLSTAIQGNYTVTVTLNGCSNSDQATLTVNAKPNISLANATVCPGTSHTFDAGAGYTYVWSGNGTGTSQTTSGTAAGAYTVIVTDNKGCKDTATGNLTLYTKPNVTVPNASICVGDPAHVFTATAGFSSYVWSDNGTGNAQSTSGTLAGPYTVTVTDGNGCKDTTTATLTVNALPQVSLADTSTCPNGSGVTLIPSPATWVSYKWSDNSTNPTLNVTVPNQSYSVQVTDANGCKNTATAFVAMGDTLQVDFGAPKDVCANQSVVLDAATYGPFSGPVTYTWFPSGANQSTLTVNSTGLFGVVVVDGRGCIGGDTVNVTIRPLPNVDLGNDTAICFTGKKAFNFNLSGSYKSVLWSTGSNGNKITVLSPKTVIVQVTNVYDCADSDTIKLSDYCDATKLCFPNVITPNGDGNNDEFIPCHDQNDSITDGNYKGILDNILNIDFKVYDRWGIRVFQSKDILPRWNGTYQNQQVSDGVYYYIVRYKDSAFNEYEQTGWVQVLGSE